MPSAFELGHRSPLAVVTIQYPMERTTLTEEREVTGPPSDMAGENYARERLSGGLRE